MFRPLRKKLTLLASVLAGSVVLLVCMVTFLLIRGQYLQSRELTFRLAVNQLETQWQLDGTLTANWLETTLLANNLHAVFWENGIPLNYPGADTSAAEQLLQGRSMSEAPLFFEQNGMRCGYAVFSFPYGYRQVLAWQEQAPEARYMFRLGCLFGCIALVSLILVSLLSWIVAGRAIVPAQEAMQRQERFIADASHELKSPLTVVRSGLEIVRTDPRQAAHYLPMLEKETERMRRLVESLLLLAGGGDSTGVYRREAIAPDTLLIDFADAMLPLANRAGVNLELDLPNTALAPICGDEALLRQLLTILTENALRYAPKSSSVELSVRESGRRCIFSVIDHGPGIPDDEKQKVFDRFYRSSRCCTETDHFGLGLSVARQIADLHGTIIQIKDTPNGGATFRFSIRQNEN